MGAIWTRDYKTELETIQWQFRRKKIRQESNRVKVKLIAAFNAKDAIVHRHSVQL